MKRRQFLKSLATTSGAVVASPFSTHLWGAAGTAYTGELYLMVQAQGGWDVASFCDPKMNVSGESLINNWAQTSEIATAGNLRYAPVANNALLFDTYYRDMLVVNGINMQTNAHDAGRTHMFTGRLNSGYPTLTAMAAAVHGAGLPMPYVSSRAESPTEGITSVTQLDQEGPVLAAAKPNAETAIGSNQYFSEADWQLLSQKHGERNARLSEQTHLLPQQRANRESFAAQRASADQLEALVDTINDTSVDIEGDSRATESLKLMLLSFKAGIAVAGDITAGGFDTHDDHDTGFDSAITTLNSGIDFLWQYADAIGIADRLNVVVLSDFARTPYYNDDEGKDHWSTGSAIFMKKNADWGNRVVGATDAGLDASALNTSTFAVEQSGGSMLYPKDIHIATRKLFGLSGSQYDGAYSLLEDVSFDLFNPALQTR